MDRKEFCDLLVRSREEAGIGKNEMCRRTGFTFVQLQLIEVKSNNFAMDKALHYLNNLDMCLCLEKGGEYQKILSIASISNWLKNAREGKYSQRALALEIGCTYSTIANIERGSNKVTIDKFLRLTDKLGYTIKIESL